MLCSFSTAQQRPLVRRAKLRSHEGQAISLTYLPHVPHLPLCIGTSSHAGLNLSGAHMHPPSMLTANGLLSMELNIHYTCCAHRDSCAVLQ